MVKMRCYSFEPSGHKFEPLNTVEDSGAFFVLSLFCPRCSRVVPTAPEHNYAGWDFASLPTDSQIDFMAGNPIVLRKTDA